MTFLGRLCRFAVGFEHKVGVMKFEAESGGDEKGAASTAGCLKSLKVHNFPDINWGMCRYDRGNGELVVSSNNKGHLTFWAPSDGRVVRDYDPVQKHGVLRGLAVLEDGRVAGAGGMGTVVLVDPRGPSSRNHLDMKMFKDVHTGLCHAVCGLPGHAIASGGQDGLVRISDLRQNGRLLHTLKGHRKDVYSLTLLADGGRLASGGADGKVRIWDSKRGRCLQTLKAANDWVMSVTPVGNGFASCSVDKTIKVWF